MGHAVYCPGHRVKATVPTPDPVLLKRLVVLGAVALTWAKVRLSSSLVPSLERGVMCSTEHAWMSVRGIGLELPWPGSSAAAGPTRPSRKNGLRTGV